jgi:hypothetical protein
LGGFSAAQAPTLSYSSAAPFAAFSKDAKVAYVTSQVAENGERIGGWVSPDVFLLVHVLSQLQQQEQVVGDIGRCGGGAGVGCRMGRVIKRWNAMCV